METLIALPDRLKARLAVSRAGSEATPWGPAPHHLAERRRGLRRGAVILPGIHGGPLPRGQEPVAGHRGRGAARPRDLGEPPRHHERARHGVPPPLSRLHASRLSPFGAPPMALRAADERRPFPRSTPHGIQNPRV
jgi:hypothetical protein